MKTTETKKRSIIIGKKEYLMPQKMLLPIKIAESIFPELSVMRRTVAARLFPASAKVRIRMRLTVIKAVSADEKNAESISKSTKKII